MINKILLRIFVCTCIFLLFTIGAEASSDDLLGYWNFDNVENNIVPDLSENELFGILSNALVEENGTCGKAISFNGQTSKIVVEEFPGFNKNLTLEAWFKMRTLWVSPYLFNQRDNPKNGRIELRCPAQLYFSAKGGTDPLEIYSTSEISIDNWYHFAVTLDNEQMKIYLNGNLEGTVAVSGNVISDASALTLGYGNTPQWMALDGLLDEVRIYNKTLSPEEIQKDMDHCHPEGYDNTLNSLGGIIQGNLQEGVKVELSGDQAATAYTDKFGRFSFSNLLAGEYTLSPQHEDCYFIPSTQHFTLDGLNINQITFEAGCTGNQSLGIKLWEFETGGYVFATPTISEDKVFIGSWDGNIYCLNIKDGEKIWEQYITPPDEVLLSVTESIADKQVYVGESIVDESRVYVTSGIGLETMVRDQGKISCLDVEDGSLIWEKSLGFVDCWPAIYRGKLYFGTFSGKLHCLEAETGKEVWSYQFGKENSNNWMEAGPVIYRGNVYFGNFSGNVFCLNAETGEELWVSALSGGLLLTPPAISKDRLYVGKSHNRQFYCLDANTGEKIWSYQAGESTSSPPAVDGGKVYFGSLDGYIYCLDAETGKECWKFQTEGNPWNYPTFFDDFCAPAVVKGNIYVGAWDNRMYCLDGETGEKIWSYDSGNWLQYFSAAVSQGKVIFGGEKKILSLKAGSEEVCGWPMFHKNLYRTGSTSVLSGKVVDENGAPLPDVQLVVKGGVRSDFIDVTTTSDVRGYYQFSELPEGAYTMHAFAEGYRVINKHLTLNPLKPIDDLDITFDQTSVCPLILAVGEESRKINTLRNFRDAVLIKCREGTYYAKVFYKHASELSFLLTKNPDLKMQVQTLISEGMPIFTSLLTGEKTIISSNITTKIVHLLNNIESQASHKLKTEINEVKTKISKGALFERLGIIVYN